MNFTYASEELLCNEKVRRESWPKMMYISRTLCDIIVHDEGKIYSWKPRNIDILAEDWQLFEGKELITEENFSF